MGKITVVTPATTRNLATLDVLKAELKITTSDNDAFLTYCIRQASGVIAEYCDRPFTSQRVKETVKGFGSMNLIVSITPITALHSIKYGDDLIEVPSSDYTIENDLAGLIRSKVGGWGHSAAQVFGTLRTPVGGSEITYYEVEYTGGFTSLTNLPYGIERACLDLCKQFYFARDRDMNIKSEAVPDVASFTYRDGSENMGGASGGGLPPQIEALLRPHRRIYL